MAKNRIYSEILSQKETETEHTFSIKDKFIVTVRNDSDKFATFRLELEVQKGTKTSDWYDISPVVSSKNPPGNSTKFEVKIIKIPPGTLVGDKIPCLAIVSSIELQSDQDRIPFYIKGLIPLDVSIIRESFYRKLKPGEIWPIGIKIDNPSLEPAKVQVEILDLDPKWLNNIEPSKDVSEYQQKEVELSIPAGQYEKVTFICQPDESALSKPEPYLFTIRVSNSISKNILKEFEGKLEILPNEKKLSCNLDKKNLDRDRGFRDDLYELEKKILQTLYGILLGRNSNTHTYNFKWNNKSNLHHKVSIEIDEEKDKVHPNELDKNEYREVVKLKKFREEVKVYQPKEIDLKPETEGVQSLEIKAEKAPWFWLFGKKILNFKIKANCSGPQVVGIENEIHIVEFPVKSKWQIRIFLLLLIFLGFLFYRWSWLNPSSKWFGHQKPVNSVEFNGLGERLVSGSDDTDLIEWKVRGFLNLIDNPQIHNIPNQNLIPWLKRAFREPPKEKAVLVIRYRPVNNDIVAAGLENGQIQLWDLTRKAKNPIACFLYDEGDRVLALEFSQDSRYLFSGHGSGRVIQWKVDYNRKNWSNTCNQQAVVRQKKFGFAVYALKFVGEDQKKLAITGGDDEDGFFSSKLAVTGRYNQLLVLNSLEDKTPLKFRYPLGGQQKYIQSLDTAEFRPDLLVSADNQGRISLWDLQKCLVNQPCQPVEQWLEGHKGEGVRSVALSADGCYLVSGGDDGRVMLWSLNSQGKLADPQKHGEEIHSNEQQQVNSVDLKINLQWGLIENQEKILIASGWDGDPQVQVKELYKKDLKYNDCNKP